MTDSTTVKYNESICVTLKQKARRLFHWAPLTALFIIFFIAAATTNCISHICHPFSSINSTVHFVIYVMEFYFVMSNYLTASFLGPGFVPRAWHPEDVEDCQKLQWCAFCESFKPPRSHHCRKCDRCVMKMDHHCPWINSCVGHYNHGFFTRFLLFAPIGCIHSTIVLGRTLYMAIYLEYYATVGDQFIVMLTLMEFLCAFFAAGLAVGVVLAVGSLWVIQMNAIMKNETGIETWIKEKSEMRDRSLDEPVFVYPYNLGRMQNIRQVLTWHGHCRGDGFRWPVKDGCGQYDITIEQIKQKKDKADHSQLYEIKKPFSGSLLPIWSFGCRIVYNSPCSDEYRLPTRPGQIMKVTRWRKHWLYGQIVYPVEDKGPGGSNTGKSRGWFPASCARPYSWVSEGDFNVIRNGKKCD